MCMKMALLYIFFTLQNQWATTAGCSTINLAFFDLVGELVFMAYNSESLPFNLVDKFHSFMASEMHGIPLFSEQLLERLASCKLQFFVQLYLLQFSTWFDNSVIRELVIASLSTQAIELINSFTSSLDDSLPITAYPIPPPSQLMIPLDDSDYTVVATKHLQNLSETTLKQIKNIKLLLISKWQITQHAVQLMAVCSSSNYLYWLIPKGVTHLIMQYGLETQEDLIEKGIIMINCLPVSFLSDGYDLMSHSLSVGPFNFLSSYSQSNNVMVTYYNCVFL